MESFTLGFPPDGQSVDPCGTDRAIPASIRDEVVRRYEAEYPGGYVLAFSDDEAGIAGFYTRTKETWKELDTIGEIVLYPTKPAKGLGFLIVGAGETNPEWPSDFFLNSSRYTKALHEWIRLRAERFATLTGKPFREAAADYDC